MSVAAHASAVGRSRAISAGICFCGFPETGGVHGSRALLELTEATSPGVETEIEGAIITQVGTFEELIQATKAGYRDIEIIEHLDATSNGLIEQPIGGVDFKHQLYPVSTKTRSIRVR